MSIPQDKADWLFAIPKEVAEHGEIVLPQQGERFEFTLKGKEEPEFFLIDIQYGRIKEFKIKHQKRYQNDTILRRLEIEGSPHKNPSGYPPLEIFKDYVNKRIRCPHIHIYVEGWNDAWAIPAPSELITDLRDQIIVLRNFLTYCHVVDFPEITKQELMDD